jgi:hypothetical protein
MSNPPSYGPPQQGYGPPPGMAPQMPPQGPPPKKPIYKRVWFWLLVGIAVIIIAANSGGDEDGGTTAADPSQPAAEQPADSGGSTAESPAPAPEPAPQDDPMEDDGWVLGEVQVETGLINSLTARITNNENSTRSAFFTITVLGPDGSLVGNATGAANDVEPGVTATVTLLSSEDLEGDPATFTYELQS